MSQITRFKVRSVCQDCQCCAGEESRRVGDWSKAEVERITREILSRLAGVSKEVSPELVVPVGISARHIHVTRDILTTLYGASHELTKMKELSQPGNFAAEEMVTVVGPRLRAMERVRILGPLRDHTQVELARTDGIFLGIELPVRLSGDIAGTPGATLIGPAGSVTLKEGVICAARHMHISPENAASWNLKNGQTLKALVSGPKEVVFSNIIVRINQGLLTEIHLDTDEANAADLSCGAELRLVSK